jgi:cyclomaltodextrinase / maltogenic alpha-amylase / neopullulanase
MSDLSDTPEWVRDAVFYQIFPDRFATSSRVPKPGPLEPWDAPPTYHGFKGGDLLGIVERLDYIESLGVNALYLTPIFASASNHRYHTYDFYHVDPLLGGDEALRELLDACHERGMRVVLDGVFNHSGRGFWPFHHVVENGAGSPYVDWFHIDHERLAAGGWLRPYPTPEERQAMDTEAGPQEHRLGDVSLRHLGYRAWWDLPPLPKLNTDNPQMREHLLGAAEHWLRFGIDGWRLDVAEEIDAGFWREFRQRVRAVRSDAYIVGEIWREKPEWLTGDTFDALMNYPLTEALISFTAGGHLDEAVVAAQHEYRDFVEPLDGPAFAARLEHILSVYRPVATAVQLNLLGSHDTPRYVTVCGGDRRSLMLATLAQMTLPGAPCVYYGDEIGLQGSHDPDCRRAFTWREEAWDTELLGFVRRVTHTRRATVALRRGEYRTLAARDAAIAYGRFGVADAERAIIALNAGDRPVGLEFEPPGAVDGWQPIDLPAMSRPMVEKVDGNRLKLDLDARSATILLAR